MKKMLKLFFSFCLLISALPTESFSQELSLSERRFHRQLTKQVNKYSKELEVVLADYDDFLNSLSLASKSTNQRQIMIAEYLLYLEDDLQENIKANPNDHSIKDFNSLKHEISVSKGNKAKEMLILESYKAYRADLLNQELDVFYREMIVEIEQHGHFEIAQALIDSKAKLNQTLVKEAVIEFFSDSSVRSAHALLDDQIDQAGGVDSFKQLHRKQKKSNRKWSCVAAKITAGALVLPLTAVTLQMGILSAPLFFGTVTAKSVLSLGGAAGGTMLNASFIRKLISGCYREKHNSETIVGFIQN
jgi:hypothetical protein